MAHQPNPYLVFTSLLFIVPMTTSAYYRQWGVYSSTVLMGFASSIYHATKHPTLLLVDKAACYYLTAVNLYFSASHDRIIVPLIGCLYCCIVFYYGYLTNQFVYYPDKSKALPWHISMHLVVVLAVVYGSVSIGEGSLPPTPAT